MRDIIKLRVTGKRPLLMHADVLANPLHERKKYHSTLTGKSKKTDEDHELIAQSEWRAGLYYDDEIGPYLPGANLESALFAGAALSKLKTQLRRSVEVQEIYCPLEYDGPRDVARLWDQKFYDARSVKIGTKRIQRFRPMFQRWALECTVLFLSDSCDAAQILKCMEDAGLYIGLGDYRPKFGRFEVAEIK